MGCEHSTAADNSRAPLTPCLRYFTQPCAGDFCAISGVLRLSCKYLIDHLRERCLRRLERDWPSTLEAWDRREDQATIKDILRYSPREHFAHPVHVIRLAHDLGLEQILPAAYYDLSRYGPRKITAGASPIPAVVLPPPGAPTDIAPQSYKAANNKPSLAKCATH